MMFLVREDTTTCCWEHSPVLDLGGGLQVHRAGFTFIVYEDDGFPCVAGGHWLTAYADQ